MKAAKFSNSIFLNHLRLVLCLSMLFTLLAHPSPAKACSCVEGTTIPNEFSQSDAVFSGKVVRIVDNYSPIFSSLDMLMNKIWLSPYFFHAGGKYWGYSVFLKIFDSWKGFAKNFIEIDTGNGMGDCGFSFALDKEYLVYASHAYGIPDNYLVAGTCSRTAEVSDAAEDLNYLNKFPVLPLRISIPILWTEKDTIVSTLLLAPIVMLIFLRRRQLQK